MKKLGLVTIFILVGFTVLAQIITFPPGSGGGGSGIITNLNFNGNQFTVNGTNINIKSGAVITNLVINGYWLIAGNTNQFSASGTNLTVNGNVIGGGSSPFTSDGTTVYLDPIVDSLWITNSAPDGTQPWKLTTTVLQTDGPIWTVGNGNTNRLFLNTTDGKYILKLDLDGNETEAIFLSVGAVPTDTSLTVISGSSTVFDANSSGAYTTGSLTTGDPGVGGTGAIKVGGLLTCSAITMVVTNYLPISINGNTNFVIPLATFTP